MRCLPLPGLCLLVATAANVCTAQQNADVLRGPYIDDDDQRHLADLQFRPNAVDSRSLQITIGATGPFVEPIGGYRGIRGANRYTAEELGMILRGEHAVQIVTEYNGDRDRIQGQFAEGRKGRIPERRLLPDGRIDYLGMTPDVYPLELIIDTNAGTPGQRTTLVIVDGQARLRCRYNIENGRITNLEVQSLGSDHHVAARNRFGRPNAIPVVFAKVKPPIAADDWSARDKEGRWVLIVNDLKRNPVHGEAWVKYLNQEKEYELLEWLAVYQPDFFRGMQVGNVLAAAAAPQWIRVAAWHCSGPANFGHGLQVASTLLVRTNPAVVEHWMKTHQKKIDNWEKKVESHYQSLLKDNIDPTDSTAYLAPLQPEDVFRYLDAPPKVRDFGSRQKIDNDETVFVHQVTRAIDGVIVSGRRDEKLLQRVRKLIHHPNEQIRQSALLSFSYLAPTISLTDRFEDFQTILNDPTVSPKIAESALLGYSYHPHPAVILRLHEVAENPKHGAWKAAVSRLGDLGHRFSIDLLARISDEALSAEQKKILRATLARLQYAAAEEKPVSSWQLTQRIAVAACARESDSKFQDAIEEWIRNSARTMNLKQRNKFSTATTENLGELWTPRSRKEFDATWESIKADIVKKQRSKQQRVE